MSLKIVKLWCLEPYQCKTTFHLMRYFIYWYTKIHFLKLLRWKMSSNVGKESTTCTCNKQIQWKNSRPWPVIYHSYSILRRFLTLIWVGFLGAHFEGGWGVKLSPSCQFKTRYNYAKNLKFVTKVHTPM